MRFAERNRNVIETGSTSLTLDEPESALARLLLLEEQAHVARVIRHNLERCHYVLDTASTVDDALQMMDTHCFDALIVSCDCSGSDLSDLCRRAMQRLAPRVHEQGASRALMMVSVGEQDDGLGRLPGLEPLSRPVSLKAIVQRLNSVFAHTEDLQVA